MKLFYTPLWVASTLAADAPANDLQFIRDMRNLKKIDLEIAQAVLKKPQNHKCYLVQEDVALTLLSSILSDKEKQDIAAKLHATEKPDSFRQGKPVFPIADPESSLLLDTLDTVSEWLLQPVAT